MDGTSAEYYSTPTWKWEPNIVVAVWGRGKATLVDRSLCQLLPEDCKGHQNNGSEPCYPGDCDNCKHFRGCDFVSIGHTPAWEEHVSGCCDLRLKKESR